jgi:hypothetical protein
LTCGRTGKGAGIATDQGLQPTAIVLAAQDGIVDDTEKQTGAGRLICLGFVSSLGLKRWWSSYASTK